MRTFPLLVAALLLAPGPADAGSKHERTRQSVSRKSGKGSGSSRRSGDGGGDAFGSCLGSCLASGCDLAGEVAVDAIADAVADRPRFERAPGIEEAPPPEPPPPGDDRWPEGEAPGDEGRPEGEAPADEAWPVGEAPEEGGAPEERRAELPPWLVPAAPGFEADREEAGPGWMPAPGEEGEEARGSEAAAGPAWLPAPGAVAEADAGHCAAVVPANAGVVPPPDPVDFGEPGPAGPGSGDTARAEDAGFLEGAKDAPAPLPPPAPEAVDVELRSTFAWIPAELPNASADLRASVRTAGAGPGIEAWYTGLWEKIDGRWDHLPLGGLRVAFALGSERVRPAFRLGGVLLDGDLLGFDLGGGLEVRLGGGEGAPRLDLHADALLFDGFVSSDLGAGVSFPEGPFFVRVGARSLYVEGFYAGPEAAIGLRL